MSELNDLIKAEKYEKAADVLYKDVLYLLNTFCPDVQITIEEFDKVAPYIVEKFQDPSKKPTPPTPEPGDDVIIDSPFRKLTIKFEGPDDEDFIAPADVVKQYAMGAKYSYACPVIKGYVADIPVVKGKMPAEDTTVKVTYSAVEPEPTDKVTLTVTYVGPVDDPDFVAPAKVIKELGFGEEYMIVSPTVEGYTPDKADVSGAAQAEDINETVTYAKNVVPPTEVTLTILYEGPVGDPDWPEVRPYEASLEVGDVYEVDSPEIEGYTPDKEVVEGIVEGTDPINVTVVYTKD